MTVQAPMRCSALAEELGEPMAGTVDQRRRWLLVEDRGAWGTDAVAGLLGGAFGDEAKARGLRVLLVRRREGDPAADVERRAMLVDTVDRTMAVRLVGDVAELSVAAAAEDPVEAFGEPMSEPIVLVCTNGKRDACCALRGRALVAALAAEHGDRLWECTHLGGHRFAGNLVCLPDGIVYGRVGPVDGPRLVRGYLDGRLDAAKMRGRSAWPAPAQVAEVELRNRLGLGGVDDVTLRGVDDDGDAATVTLGAGGREHWLRLIAEHVRPPRPISCRADALEAPRHWRVVTDGG